jgi:class 3 adenylate cyclase/tetratricopeptide (TPR) repeat protein
MSACRACGAVPPAGARFCPSCGTPTVIAATVRGERRIVSVLFADLVNVGTVAEHLDPEAVRNLLERCFTTLTSVVLDHGGTVDKVVGDELMAVFGVPTVHEDDAERAVRAGLGLHDALASVAPELVLRVGINTGEVLAAPAGLAAATTVTGDAVNTAHRLVSVARPGEVLVGERTWLATRGAMEFESRPAFRLRGKRDDVRAFAAVGALGLPGERPWQSRTTPLVGRTEELGRLRAAARRAFETATPAVVTVTGEAGMGKTRLVLELHAELWERLPSGLFLWGRCPSYGAPPVWPLAEVIRVAFGIEATDSRTASREKLDAGLAALTEADGLPVDAGTRGCLRQLLGLSDPGDGTRRRRRTPDAARTVEGLLEAAIAILERLASGQPTMVVLDDLHWADEALLVALRELPERSAEVPLLVIAVGRSEIVEGAGPLRIVGAEEAIHLRPLTDDEVDIVLEHLLGAPQHPSLGAGPAPVTIDAASRRRILDTAAGNPFFLEELVNYLLDTGALSRQADRWVLGGERAEALPDSVRAVVGARLDALPDRERRFLQDAAVAGEHFDRQAVAEVGGWEPDEVDELVRALVQRGLLERRPADEIGDLAFRHVLTRDVVYASVPLGVRAGTHTGVAAWMERRLGMDLGSEALIAVAHHYEQVVLLGRQLDEQDPLLADRAWVALLRAANQAVGQDALHEADRLFERARQIIGDDHASGVVEVLLDHAEVQDRLGRRAAAIKTYDAVLEAARETGRADAHRIASERLAALRGDDRPSTTLEP